MSNFVSSRYTLYKNKTNSTKTSKRNSFVKTDSFYHSALQRLQLIHADLVDNSIEFNLFFKKLTVMTSFNILEDIENVHSKLHSKKLNGEKKGKRKFGEINNTYLVQRSQNHGVKEAQRNSLVVKQIGNGLDEVKTKEVIDETVEVSVTEVMKYFNKNK